MKDYVLTEGKVGSRERVEKDFVMMHYTVLDKPSRENKILFR